MEDLDTLENYHKPSLPFYSTHPEQLEWLYSMSDDRLTIDSFKVGDLTRNVWLEHQDIGKREIEEYLSRLSKGIG